MVLLDILTDIPVETPHGKSAVALESLSRSRDNVMHASNNIPLGKAVQGRYVVPFLPNHRCRVFSSSSVNKV
jgi:hypothetical protein